MRVCQDSLEVIQKCSQTYKEFIIFLDSTKLKIVWIKITTFFKQRFSHTMIFFKLTDYYKISDIYINHNNCLGHMLIT